MYVLVIMALLTNQQEEKNMNITSFNYKGATISSISKDMAHVDAYQIYSNEGGWIDALYSAEYLISLGAKECEIKAL